ncbi:MAG: ferritin-like domain-containing protein [Acidimicrobiales bacterium]
MPVERRGEVASAGVSRRDLLAGLGACGLLAGGWGGLLSGLIAAPARDDEGLDRQILQTASSLEVLAVATYSAALSLDFIRNGNPVIARFVQTAMIHHDEHRKAFQALTKTLGGTEQANPNPTFAPVVEQARPSLRTAVEMVTLAETLETVVTQTYLQNASQLDHAGARRLAASVMGVESQHAATLRTMKVLLEAGLPDLLKIPLDADLARVPAQAGGTAFPEPFEPVTNVAEPASGAVA